MSKDTKNELRNAGIMMLAGRITSESISAVCADFLYLNTLENPNFSAARLILNSPGGTCADGFMLIDIMQLCKFPVHVTGLGICASMGIMALVAGEKGHRTITENTMLLAHQFSAETTGKYHELTAAQKEWDLLHIRVLNHFVAHTKLSRDKVKKILLPPTDSWLTGAEAKRYGIVDKII